MGGWSVRAGVDVVIVPPTRLVRSRDTVVVQAKTRITAAVKSTFATALPAPEATQAKPARNTTPVPVE